MVVKISRFYEHKHKLRKSLRNWKQELRGWVVRAARRNEDPIKKSIIISSYPPFYIYFQSSHLSFPFFSMVFAFLPSSTYYSFGSIPPFISPSFNAMVSSCFNASSFLIPFLLLVLLLFLLLLFLELHLCFNKDTQPRECGNFRYLDQSQAMF